MGIGENLNVLFNNDKCETTSNLLKENVAGLAFLGILYVKLFSNES